jgi:hypothetical protein
VEATWILYQFRSLSEPTENGRVRCAITIQFLTPSFLAEFIEAIRQFPCIWKTKSEDFKNKLKRDEALQVLLAMVRTKVPNADLEFLQKKKKTPWLWSASELYRPSDCRLLAKLMPTLADRGCCVVSATNPHGL